MIYRAITSQGFINISKNIRGRLLAKDVALTLREDGPGLRIAQYDPLITYPPGVKLLTFDNFDRIRIPPNMRSDAGLVASAEISIEPDGCILVAPVQQACAICGKTKELTEMRADKYLCHRCAAEALERRD